MTVSQPRRQLPRALSTVTGRNRRQYRFVSCCVLFLQRSERPLDSPPLLFGLLAPTVPSPHGPDSQPKLRLVQDRCLPPAIALPLPRWASRRPPPDRALEAAGAFPEG